MAPAGAVPIDQPGCGHPAGMEVAAVAADSAAARAGLIPGETILALDGVQLTTPRSLAFAIADQTGGPMVRLRVWRCQGRGHGEVGTLALDDGSAPDVGRRPRLMAVRAKAPERRIG